MKRLQRFSSEMKTMINVVVKISSDKYGGKSNLAATRIFGPFWFTKDAQGVFR